jgi:hypothetical protein
MPQSSQLRRSEEMWAEIAAIEEEKATAAENEAAIETATE